MRPRTQGQHVVIGSQRQDRQIEAVRKVGKGAGRAGGKAGEIEGQPARQQLEPILLPGPGRLGMGRIIGEGIMADAGRPLAGDKGPDCEPIGPLAMGKQQVQLGIIGALRL
jgi:hypothetical protein